MKYAVYAENLDGERRFLAHCIADNVGRGIFDLYDDECGDEEEIVIVPIEESPGAVLGKKGGSVRSDKKTTSSRENGKKGGRPKKEVAK